MMEGADVTWTDHDAEAEERYHDPFEREHADHQHVTHGMNGGARGDGGSGGETENEGDAGENGEADDGVTQPDDGVRQVPGTEYPTCSSKREVGKLAVWSVTSNKPGNGVEYLRDDNVDTFWQSDGTQPHLVNVQFQRKVRIAEVVLYVDYRNDESYTPQKVSFRVGNSYYDLQEIKTVELEEPQGWVVIPLAHRPRDAEGGAEGGGGPPGFVRAHCLQIAVLSNHQNGRDTHLRQVKVFGPRVDVTRSADQPFSFEEPEFSMYARVR